ncbi:hypothetical protein SPHINGO391_470390 [Sphingomonas aurantiaca]|uniref:Uncharacterized protein n=1 Tax=Sphingomonas aurantiaca TaxID=185949 RepID=A0A5E7ZVG4_9SPHN|nr:hypothetical protein SPHINGO391_470390 [Sphingomonas aurantiaca]
MLALALIPIGGEQERTASYAA